MESEKLKQLGFDENEVKIYLSLLELTESQAGELSKKTQINRTTVYDSLSRLIDKGFVTYVLSANKKIFRPVSPKKILASVKEKEKIAEELVPKLEKIYSSSPKSEEANIYHGKKGIKVILTEILSFKEYSAFGSSGGFRKYMKTDFVGFQLRKKELKIKSRVLQSTASKKNKELKKVSFTTFRYLPKEYLSPSTTILYGDKIAIIVWSETPIATVIKSKEVLDSFMSYFEVLWTVAKP